MKTLNSIKLLSVSLTFLTLTGCNKEQNELISSRQQTVAESTQVTAARSGAINQIYSQLDGAQLSTNLANQNYTEMNNLSDNISSDVMQYMSRNYGVDVYRTYLSSNPDPTVIRDNAVILGLIYSFLENVDLGAIDLSNPNWINNLRVGERCYYDAVFPVFDHAYLVEVIQLAQNQADHQTIVTTVAKYIHPVDNIATTFQVVYDLGVCQTWW